MSATKNGPVSVGSAGPATGVPAAALGRAQSAVAAEKRRPSSRVAVEESGVGGGGSTEGGPLTASALRSAQAFGGAVAPPFVEASRLTAVSRTQPDYPADALAHGVTGEVVVQAIISRTGAVESAQIVSGPPGLLKASLDAMKSWRYQPYLVNGEPVEVRTYVKFRFDGNG